MNVKEALNIKDVKFSEHISSESLGTNMKITTGTLKEKEVICKNAE